MPDPKKIKTSLYLPEDVFWKLKEETVRRRFSTDTAAMEEAIKTWIDAPEPPPSGKAVPAGNRWHQMLADILASGDREAISAVQHNLMVFHRVKIVTSTAASTPPKPTTSGPASQRKSPVQPYGQGKKPNGDD